MSEIRPSGDLHDQHDDNRLSLRQHFLRVARWIAAVAAFAALVVSIAVPLLVNSSRFHSYVIRTVQQEAGDALGVPVVLQNFSLHLGSLGVDLYGLTVSGANGHPNPPPLQVQHIQASVKIVSVIRRKWYLDNLRIDRPIIQVFVDSHGVSNIPTFRSGGTSNNNNEIFDLGIRHAVITAGEVFYNNQPSALAADLKDVELTAFFNDLQQKYSGTLGYSDGHLTYGTTSPQTHSLSVQFDATPTTLHLSPAKLIVGKSQLTLNATLVNYSNPAIQAQYNLITDGAQLAQALHNSNIPAGLVSANGTLQYRQLPHHTLLDSLQITGDLRSARLDLKTTAARTAISNLIVHYSLANGGVTLKDLRANLLGGEVTAQGVMKNLSGDSHTLVNAGLRGVSVADVRRTFVPSQSMQEIAATGTLNATASASWDKTFNDLIAHADATIAAQVAGTQAAAPQQAPAGATPTSAAIAVPVQSEVHLTYTAKDQRLAVDKSFLRTAQTNLAMSGVVSNRSSLNLHLQANDLGEIEAIANIFRTSPSGGPPPSLGLAGSATFQGVVHGSTSAPHLTGQLTVQNLQVNGTALKVFSTDIDASPSQISLSHADIEPSTHGKLTFSATAGLDKWKFSDSSPVQLEFHASQLDVADLMKMAGQQVPVTGTLNANIALHGTQLDPVGNGKVTLTHAVVYDEPVSSAELTFAGAEHAARGNLDVQAPAGTLQSKFLIHPRERTYSAELSSSGIHLDKLHAVTAANQDISGVVAVNARGEGSFHNPRGSALIQIPTLLVQGRTVSDVKLQVDVADHFATANLTSSAVKTAIGAHAKVALTGDYVADAALDTRSIPLGPLLAAYAPDQASNISGETELHATLHGPLKDVQHIEAHATIPVLKLAYVDNFQLAAPSPIHIDLKDGVVSVPRSSIRGTDTDLQFEGSIPVNNDAPMSLVLLGTVNLHIVEVFDPELKSSGELKFNINSSRKGNVGEFGGSVDIIDAGLSSPDLPLALQHTNGSLTLAKDRVNIANLKGTLGGGTVSASGGVIFQPAVRFDVGLQAQGVRMLYPQGMRESMDANLRLTGSNRRAQLGGSVNVTDVSFTQAFDLNSFIGQFTDSIEAPPSRGFAQNVALNLAVHSSNNVNLVSRTLSVGGSANLQVRGSLADPVILGRAILTGGDLILNNKRFVLTGGSIQFVNPSKTEPVVNLALTTSIQQYNITLRFEGPVDQLRTQYTSDPSLPSADVINLLALGRTTEAAAANATPTNQAAQSLVASQVSSQITSRVSKIAGISQLTINPVLPNGNSQGQQPGANITIQQRVTGHLFITYTNNVASTQSQTIQGQYQVSPRVSVSGTGYPNGGFAFDTLVKRSW
jgi:translocation and assembly module TamB